MKAGAQKPTTTTTTQKPVTCTKPIDKETSTNKKNENGTFVFKVYGYGHGVGMSQYGANYLANEGKNYIEILKTYYTGVEVEKINK